MGPRSFIQWWYAVIDFFIMTSSISKLLHSWLFIDFSEHHYTTQTSKFNFFFNRSSTMLNNVLHTTRLGGRMTLRLTSRHRTLHKQNAELRAWRIRTLLSAIAKMRNRGPQPVVKIWHVKNANMHLIIVILYVTENNVDMSNPHDWTHESTARLENLRTWWCSRMRHNTSCRVVRLWVA